MFCECSVIMEGKSMKLVSFLVTIFCLVAIMSVSLGIPHECAFRYDLSKLVMKDNGARDGSLDAWLQYHRQGGSLEERILMNGNTGTATASPRNHGPPT